MTGALDWAEGAPPPPVYPSPSRSSCAPPLPPSSLKHLVGLVGELPQTHHSSASHPSSVANAAAITASLQACAEWGGWGGGERCVVGDGVCMCGVGDRCAWLLWQFPVIPLFPCPLRMAAASPTSAWPASGACWMPTPCFRSTACVGCWRRTGPCLASLWS